MRPGLVQRAITFRHDSLHPLKTTVLCLPQHYAMGRKSNEMGVVMPDQRTVYMSDDGTNTAQYKFIADQKADLSSGAPLIISPHVVAGACKCESHCYCLSGTARSSCCRGQAWDQQEGPRWKFALAKLRNFKLGKCCAACRTLSTVLRTIL